VEISGSPRNHGERRDSQNSAGLKRGAFTGTDIVLH
jgi:hypothetical protein